MHFTRKSNDTPAFDGAGISCHNKCMFQAQHDPAKMRFPGFCCLCLAQRTPAIQTYYKCERSSQLI